MKHGDNPAVRSEIHQKLNEVRLRLQEILFEFSTVERLKLKFTYSSSQWIYEGKFTERLGQSTDHNPPESPNMILHLNTTGSQPTRRS